MPDDSTDGTGGRPDSVEPPRRSNRTVTPAIAAALVVLAASFALSVAFVLANGGLDLPAAQRPSSSTDAVGGAPTPTASAATATAVAEASALRRAPPWLAFAAGRDGDPGASAAATPTPGTTPARPRTATTS